MSQFGWTSQLCPFQQLPSPKRLAQRLPHHAVSSALCGTLGSSMPLRFAIATFRLAAPSVSRPTTMGKAMSPKQAALCYFYRKPPAGSGAKPQKFVGIPKLVGGKPLLTVSAVKWAVYNFHNKSAPRGRPAGWRKTTKAEDQRIVKSFKKVRQPLGCGVEFQDVLRDLPDALRKKISKKTLGRRLAEKGFTPQEKKAGDDEGELWRQTRLSFAKRHRSKSELQWINRVQAVGDYWEAIFYPPGMKTRHKIKRAPRTIMSKAERNKAAFQKPRRKIFKLAEFKKSARKAKVFGLTTAIGNSLVLPAPLNPTTSDWAKMVPRIAEFLQGEFPQRTSFTLLLDGEKIFHTDEAKRKMEQHGLRILPDWPPNSPDLNPQENVWSTAKKLLRKAEQKGDTFSVFKRRVIHAATSFPNKDALVPSLHKRMALCIAKKGYNIGK